MITIPPQTITVAVEAVPTRGAGGIALNDALHAGN
jgi:hypothetical protein